MIWEADVGRVTRIAAAKALTVAFQLVGQNPSGRFCAVGIRIELGIGAGFALVLD